MRRVLPETAFEDYLQMGDRRSYRALAEKYNCNKRTIVTRAALEHWQDRLLQMQMQSRESVLTKFGEDDAAIRERHLKMLRAVQARALESLRAKPFESAADAAKALLQAQAAERELLHIDTKIRQPGAATPTLQIERTIREVSERRIVSADDAHKN